MRFNSTKYIPLLVSLVLSLQLTIEAYSQEPDRGASTGGAIHGTVKSGGKPIAGATIRLLELDRSAFSDVNGRFTFPGVPNGTYNVFVHVIGYASASNKVSVAGADVTTSFALHESAIEAAEVVVSASPYARPADKEYQSAQSKSMVELHDSPGSSFAEKISDLPGIEVRYNGSAPARPMIRGLSDNEVLILENGLRTGDVSTYDPAHSVPIEPLSISRIEVVRGPACIMYGPNTIGGLIDAITNTIPTASSSPVSGRVSLSGNSASDEYTGYLNTIYSSGGHALGISAGGLHSQDIRIPAGNYFDGVNSLHLDRMPQSFDHSQEEGAGYSYQGDFGMVGVGYKHYEMSYGIPGTPPNPDWIDDPPTTSLIDQTKNSVEARSLFVVDGPAIQQIRVTANYVDYNHSEFPTQQDSTGVSNPEANHFHKQAVNAMVQLQHPQFGPFRGTIGLWTNVENLTIEGEQPLGPNSITTGLAGYIFEEYLAGDEMRLQAGLRYDYNRIHAVPYSASLDSVFQTIDVTRHSGAVTASIGAIRDFPSGMTASLSIARSFRAPTVQELFADGADAASNTYSIGDANLVSETSVGIDASLKGRFTNVSFELTPYVDLISNYIYTYLRGDTIQDLPVRQFAATNSRLMGFEITAAVQPMDFMALQCQADYVNAEDTRNNVPLPFTPPLRGLFKMIYQDNTYSATLEWRLAASQKRLGVGDTYTAGYGVVNIGAGLRLTQEGLIHNISLHCDNLLNQVYRDNLSVIKDFIPQPGRGFQLNYDLEFGN
ncbi:MAG TPA: TonB-dependent receptor [Candidatus Acidoferrales bacterium]|nr:TonB-dependent receptor [Candidatus Acidoferrales bacterium]